jgi:hypothetical protein
MRFASREIHRLFAIVHLRQKENADIPATRFWQFASFRTAYLQAELAR